MTQGVLPFKYEEEESRNGMTALAGLPVYLDLAEVRNPGTPYSLFFRPVFLRLSRLSKIVPKCFTKVV